MTPTPGRPVRARQRRDVDDLPAPLLLHDGDHGLAAEEEAGHVDAHHLFEELQRHLLDRLVARDPGVVDQDIHPAEFLDDLVKGSDHLLFLHRIRLDVQRPLAGRIEGIRDGLRRAGSIPGDDRGAFGVATLGNPLPQPLSRPRDDDHQILHFVHGILLSVAETSSGDTQNRTALYVSSISFQQETVRSFRRSADSLMV